MAEQDPNNNTSDQLDQTLLRADLKLDSIRGFGAETKQKVAKSIADSGIGFSKEQVHNAIPIVGAAALAGGSLLLAGPIGNGAKGIFKFAGKALTGFGLLDNVPILGGLMKSVGKGLESIGKYAGYAIAPLAGALGYIALSDKKIQNMPEVKSGYSGLAVSALPPKTEQVTVFTRDGTPVYTDVVPKAPADNQAVVTPQVIKLATDNKWDKSKIPDLSEIRRLNKDPALEAALKEFMQYQVFEYENRKRFLSESEIFAYEGRRDKLVKALVGTGTHTHAEANALIVNHEAFFKDVSPYIYAKEKRDIPADLDKFATEFEKIYEKHLPYIKAGDESGLQNGFMVQDVKDGPLIYKKYEKMNPSQKMQFIDCALRFCDNRMAEFGKYKKTKFNGDVTLDYWDFKDCSKPYEIRREGWRGDWDEFWFKNHDVGYPNLRNRFGEDMAVEFDKVKKVLGIEHTKIVSPYKIVDTGDFRLGPADTYKSEIGGKLRESWESFKAQQNQYDAHLHKIVHESTPRFKGYERHFDLMQHGLQLGFTHQTAITDIQLGENGQLDLIVKDIRHLNPAATNQDEVPRWIWRGTQQGETFTVTEIFDQTGHQVPLSQEIKVNLKTGDGIKVIQALTDAHIQKPITDRSAGKLAYQDAAKRLTIEPVVIAPPPAVSNTVIDKANAPANFTVTDKQSGMKVRFFGHTNGDAFTIHGYQVIADNKNPVAADFHKVDPGKHINVKDAGTIKGIMEGIQGQKIPHLRYDLGTVIESSKFDQAAQKAAGLNPTEDKHVYAIQDKITGKRIHVYGKREGGQFTVSGYEILAEGGKPGKIAKLENLRVIQLGDPTHHEHIFKLAQAREDVGARFNLSAIALNDRPSKEQIATKIWPENELKTMHIQNVRDHMTGMNLNLHGKYDAAKGEFEVLGYEVITTPGKPGTYHKLDIPNKLNIKNLDDYGRLMTGIANIQKVQFASLTPPADGLNIEDGTNVSPLSTALASLAGRSSMGGNITG